MRKLSRAMMERMLPTAPRVDGTVTFRRSRILIALLKAHGRDQWEYVHVLRDGYEYRCVQCGRARDICAGKRCGRCHLDNALCKILRPGPRGELLATLLEGERDGRFEMVPIGMWQLGWRDTSTVSGDT